MTALWVSLLYIACGGFFLWWRWNFISETFTDGVGALILSDMERYGVSRRAVLTFVLVLTAVLWPWFLLSRIAR